MIIAYILIIVGILFFLKNTEIVVWNWSIIWPLLLIGFGVYIAWTWKKAGSWFKQAWGKVSKKLE